jgi:hypothetical protein
MPVLTAAGPSLTAPTCGPTCRPILAPRNTSAKAAPRPSHACPSWCAMRKPAAALAPERCGGVEGPHTESQRVAILLVVLCHLRHPEEPGNLEDRGPATAACVQPEPRSLVGPLGDLPHYGSPLKGDVTEMRTTGPFSTWSGSGLILPRGYWEMLTCAGQTLPMHRQTGCPGLSAHSWK